MTFTLGAAGDAIITRRLSTVADEGFRTVVDRLNAADAAVVNLETTVHEFEGYPARRRDGLNLVARPFVLDELRWAGFTLFAAANNHMGDYAHGGMVATMEALESRDLRYAGLGRSLSAARAPAYADTPAGRVALVAACTTFPPEIVAGTARPDVQGRPGIAPLRLRTEYTLPESELDRLRSISDRLGLEAARGERFKPSIPAGEAGFHLLDPDGGLDGAGSNVWFSAGDEPAVTRHPNEEDLSAIGDRIREARRQADWVITSVHSHEGRGWRRNDPSIPPFLEAVARSCIDDGADAFVSHGPHLLRGIEIYRDRPIFYSLGTFLKQQETMSKVPQQLYDAYDLPPTATPADVYDRRYFEDGAGGLEDSIHPSRAKWETVVPICRYGDGVLDAIDLYPMELGGDRPRPQRGQSRLATGDTATRILDRLASLSAPYGTEITVGDGIGRIRS